MRVLCIALLAVLTGCASQVAKLNSELATQPSCCATLGELPFDPLAGEQELRFTIGPGDKAFDFPSGKSYAKGFELAKGGPWGGLEVRTYLVGSWIPSAHAFGPFFQFLDASRVSLGEPLFASLYYDEGIVEGARWTGVVKIPDGARYVVIFTKPELVKFKRIPLASTAGYATMVGSSVVYVPPSGARSSSYGPAGELRLRLQR